MYATHQTHENEMSSSHRRIPNPSLEMKPNLSVRPPVSIFHDVRVTYNATPSQKRQPLQLITDEEAKAILIEHLLTFLNLSQEEADCQNILYNAIKNNIDPKTPVKLPADLVELGAKKTLENLKSRHFIPG